MSRQATLCHFLDQTAHQGGEYWECGTFRGDTAIVIKRHLGDSSRTMRLFDTFAGQPFSGPHDRHAVGSMAGTSRQVVEDLFAGLAHVTIHEGVMPDTFTGLEDSVISVVNIDVDNHDSVRDCLAFVYPRVPAGGYIVLDDYQCPDCPGAKIAADDFLRGKPEQLIVPSDSSNPQAYFVKL